MKMPDWNSQSYDAIVIGSGPGGATIALELSRQGKKVMILEWGSAEPIKGTALQAIQMALIPGRGLFMTPDFLGLMRAITLGGSSVMAYATAFEPPYSVFEEQKIDLKPYVSQAMAELPISPLADELIGPTAQRLMTSAQALGLPWEKLPKMVHQEKCRPGCDKCTLGCPYGAKWTAREFIDQAVQHGATLLTGAKVSQLIVENDAVTGVRFLLKGSAHTTSAPRVILAAGGIGSPMILNKSGIKAGEEFFIDPLVILVGTLDGLDDGHEFPMATGFHDAQEGYVIADCVFPWWVLNLFTLPVMRIDRLGGHRKSLQLMIKVKDDLSGKITARGWVNKRITKDDRSRLRRGSELGKEILEHAGARNIYSCMTIAAHPGGSAKIGDVVDVNLKTRLKNLYVCDCSVIPTSWGRPPILTLVALGKRLGEHLAAQAN